MNDQQYVIVPKTAKQVPQILADFLANSELTTNVTITVTGDAEAIKKTLGKRGGFEPNDNNLG